VTMEYYADEFERVCDTGLNSVAFRLRKPFAPGRLRPRLVEELTVAEKAALMERAADRFPPEQAAILRAAAANFLAMLEEEGALKVELEASPRTDPGSTF
jgi:hypothetical protein